MTPDKGNQKPEGVVATRSPMKTETLVRHKSLSMVHNIAKENKSLYITLTYTDYILNCNKQIPICL